MTDDKLAKGVELQGDIAKLNRLIERLSDPGFFVQLRENDVVTNSLISTVGTGENCEHELAQYATRFQQDVLMHYEARLADKQLEYDAL